MTRFKTDKEEEGFQSWVKKNKINVDPNDMFPDYDMRGFYSALQKRDPKATSAIDPHDKQIHYPDYWKTPYHESFSAESKWAKPGAPSWNEMDQLVTPQGKVIYEEGKPIMANQNFNKTPQWLAKTDDNRLVAPQETQQSKLQLLPPIQQQFRY